nr:MAG TPA: hypothetical protein [Caudoviricetes sp.]
MENFFFKHKILIFSTIILCCKDKGVGVRLYICVL